MSKFVSRWKNVVSALAVALLAYAPVVPLNGCTIFWFGEPKLPKKLQK